MSESVKIIENGFVITCDRQERSGRHAILVKNDRISELNTSAGGFKARFPSAEVVDAGEKVIFPGFIDPHYHGESFILRNWTAGTPMTEWERLGPVRNAFNFVYREASTDDLLPIFRAAYFAALKSGVTSLAEFCFDHLDIPFLAAREAMKRSDLKGFVGVHNAEQADQARLQKFPSVRHALVLPGEEMLTTYNLQTTLRSAEEHGWPMMAHVGESRRGPEAAKRNFHRPIVTVLEEYKIFDRPLQLSHAAFLEEEELAILAARRVPVIVNPAAILAKRTDPPPIAEFLARGIPVAIASDWGSPDPFANMRALSTLLRLANGAQPDPFAVIAMHTMNAARALGIHEETGSVEPGKKADLTFVDLADLRFQLPLEHALVPAVRNLLEYCSSAQVSDVMINGEFFVRRGQVMTYAEEDLKREHQEIVARIAARTGTNEEVPGETAAPILQLHQPVDRLTEDESFEEGFRIVGTTGSITDQTPRPQSEDEKRKSDLPGNVRRVFGDDDY